MEVPDSEEYRQMQIDVRFHGLQSSHALRRHITKRLNNHLGRFSHELTRVIVRIGDVNGPKGGVDKRCKITVRGPRVGTSTLDELSNNAYAAVNNAVHRLTRAVGRRIERARQRSTSTDGAVAPQIIPSQFVPSVTWPMMVDQSK